MSFEETCVQFIKDTVLQKVADELKSKLSCEDDGKMYIDNTDNEFDSVESIIKWLNDTIEVESKKKHNWYTEKQFVKKHNKGIIMCTYSPRSGKDSGKICGNKIKYSNSDFEKLRCKECETMIGNQLSIFQDLKPISAGYNSDDMYDAETENEDTIYTLNELKRFNKTKLKTILTNFGLDSSGNKNDMCERIIEYQN